VRGLPKPWEYASCSCCDTCDRGDWAGEGEEEGPKALDPDSLTVLHVAAAETDGKSQASCWKSLTCTADDWLIMCWPGCDSSWEVLPRLPREAGELRMALKMGESGEKSVARLGCVGISLCEEVGVMEVVTSVPLYMMVCVVPLPPI
jgi:hypothetical protein